MADALLGLVLLAHLVGLACAVLAILHARTPQGAIAWAVSLVAFPWLAVPFFVVFGRARFHGYFRARRRRAAELAAADVRLGAALAPFELPPAGAGEADAALRAVASQPFTRGNAADLLVDGEATFASLLAGIAAARTHIAAQFYIVRDDATGRRIRDALAARAREGVVVHFLYDRVGSIALPDRFLRPLREAGGHVAAFRSARGWSSRFQLNFRNHRKLMVVDGAVAWVGGHNLGDEYLGLDPAIGPWRDTFVRVEGPAALGVQLVFARDWVWGTGELPALPWQARAAASGDAEVLVCPSDPSTELEEAALMYRQALAMARRRCWIATPYFVPDSGTVTALQLAGLRGVDVRLLLTERSDNRVADLAARAYLPPMAAAGVRIFLYRGGFMHQKCFVVDDSLAGVGTANFDNRSFRLNFELTLLVRDARFVHETATMLQQDLAHAVPLDAEAERRRPWHHRLLVRLARLTAPVQ
ncbi:MAG: cardiolipin synthase [Gemmatimonadales bacterium]|nr:cardiolipin synthase [Gemmatimonadales bacterium]